MAYTGSMRDYWQQQTAEKPLNSGIMWSRPETKSTAGKMLIVGGNAHGFAAPAEASTAAQKAGIGTSRVLLPSSLSRTIPAGFLEVEFAPSTPSGSFARTALAELLDFSAWADGVLLAGDFGRNSETAVLLEEYARKYKGLLAISGDAIDYFMTETEQVLARQATLLVPSFQQLQKLLTAAGHPTALTSDMGLLKFVDVLHEITEKYAVNLMINYEGSITAAVNGKVSTTKLKEGSDASEIVLSADGLTWWIQNPTKPFDALSAAALQSA